MKYFLTVIIAVGVLQLYVRETDTNNKCYLMDCDQPYSRKKVTVGSIELDIAVSDDEVLMTKSVRMKFIDVSNSRLNSILINFTLTLV